MRRWIKSKHTVSGLAFGIFLSALALAGGMKIYGAGTGMQEQAERWATRYGRKGYVNCYEYIPDKKLKYLIFEEMTEEWLDFIVACRSGQSHDYDIVEGPMADDTIYNYVQNFIDGKISRAAFWELVKFNHPTHQISFHTISALDTLQYVGSEAVNGNKK